MAAMQVWRGPFIAAGGYKRESGMHAVQSGAVRMQPADSDALDAGRAMQDGWLLAGCPRPSWHL